MKLKVYLGTSLLVLSSFGAFAAEPPKMTAQEKAEMDAMMKASTPGAEHKKLAGMVGTWNASMKMWNAPGAPPMTSTGVSKNTAVLGGRFIQQDFSGTFMGGPFNGIGYTGFDNVTRQYQGTWMDTMATGVMVSHGKASGDNALDFEASMPDPMSGKNVAMKEKVTIVNKDKHVLEMWAPDRSGKEYKMMEITYTRK